MNLPKIYEPHQYEADIYTLWETSDSFKPAGGGTPYSIIMPPPNANASLHIGHALMIVIEDILVRYHRMKGDRTIWIPGADHAGFETWVVYEKHLEKQSKSRFDYSRDELYDQVWQFVAENRGLMEIQLRELGASCDWSKLVFTLDDSVIKTTYQTFQKMWNEGLIYRGERIVSYCTKHDTSFADIEVVYKTETSYLWHIAFPLSDGKGSIEIATTRPETMVGDVAVAVNPKDKRYTTLVGKTIKLPLTDRVIPIIADEMVDMEFGTGAVKITPAHDPNDFEVVERHKLGRFSVIGFDGTMNDNAPEAYQGLDVLAAREAIVKDLDDLGLVVAVEPYEHSVGHCYKCDTVIQPLLKDQWFIATKKLAQPAIAALQANKIQFVPDNKNRVLVSYLKDLKDWNISRQIPWGIAIPAFQNIAEPDDWIFDERVSQQEITVNGKTYRRDPDTFDTWFSSGQWPYIVTKNHDSGELGEFFPNSVMETAGDILFAWVARMIMFSLYLHDEIPFKDVYLHGLVTDTEGKKMSKSKGNVINPQEILQEYGSDALRLGLIAARSAGQNQAFGKDKVIAGRNFCNKLWNIARFIEATVPVDQQISSADPQPSTAADHWIVQELSSATTQLADMLQNYRFAEGFETLYHTIWDKVADWYLEASKTAPSASTMVWVLETCLKLAHPFAPFVTETIWQTLKWNNTQLISSPWPEVAASNSERAEAFEQLQQVIIETREILAAIGSTDISMSTVSSQLVLDNAELIRRMSRVGYVETVEEGSGLRLTSTHEHVWLDLDPEQINTYKQTLEKKLADTEKAIESFERRLSSSAYLQKAPKSLVEDTKHNLASKLGQAEHYRHQLKHL